jgi:single-strand DNA-binding protein
MNNITIAGQLGRDAELKNVNNDKVLSFSVADSQGKEKPAIWWNCAIWGKRAELLEPYLKKGQAVTVAGKISQREYTDKDGIKRTAMEIYVSDTALQGGKPQTADAPRPAARPADKPAGSGFDDMDDDIPF